MSNLTLASAAGLRTRVLLGAIGAAAVAASFLAAPGLTGLCGALLAVVMLAIAIVDWRTLQIPNGLNLAAAALGVLYVGLENPTEAPGAVGEAALRAIFAAALFFAFRVVYRRLRGREGLGLGDVKLAGAAGLWLDLRGLSIAVEIAAVAELAGVCLWRWRTGRSLDRFEKLPFGALLAPAIWLCWLMAEAG